ncbi:MAG: PilZ domain-containing protein [Xanthomonadaceae bacterium]|nr:PilZ domain-containing protein [Xanthomonadaceae bacterium]MDE1961838.1 PilZ domain-containing protein [Xanthomonadaceae bacterium]MDE2084649.1 PilZ domain-containing protein [Xanthomonadaceae bacterium]MDE2257553.1 PilZ domain-containing protein [Xanthomonadaceae bacterium]
MHHFHWQENCFRFGGRAGNRWRARAVCDGCYLPCARLKLRDNRWVDPVAENTTQYSGFRHARKPMHSAVLLIHGAEAWPSEVEDISATGALVARPEDWQGKVGDLYALDMVIGEELNIHVEATVARITEHHLGFAYARIPPEKEVPLWNLLGGYADKIEPFDD